MVGLRVGRIGMRRARRVTGVERAQTGRALGEDAGGVFGRARLHGRVETDAAGRALKVSGIAEHEPGPVAGRAAQPRHQCDFRSYAGGIAHGQGDRRASGCARVRHGVSASR